MTEQATKAGVEALASRVGELIGAVEKQADAIRGLSGEQVQTNTMLRSFVGEQRARNERIDRLMDQHTREIGELQKFKVKVEATTPAKLLDGESIEKRFAANEAAASTLQGAVNKINVRLAYWAGGIGVALVLVEIGLKVFF
jgi:hypothetical protein